ncbi:MAG: hypothetical protein ACE5EZ_02480 [Thermodesulfobacteriota bacterium]
MERRLITAIAVLAATLFLSPTLSTAETIGSYTDGTVANGIASSRHNLGWYGRVLRTEGTTQICVFCHTPHHTNTQSTPLWNRDVSNSVNYAAYGTTIAGTTINNADLGGPTLACLSCHDGTTTFDSLVNAPGKGGLVPGGQDGILTTGGSTVQWIFKMPGNLFESQNFDHFDTTGGACAGCHSSFFGGPPLVGTASTVQALAIGEDLTNDHPVSVPYSASSKASLRPINTIIGDIDLTLGLVNTTSYYTNLQQNRWAVSGFISSTASIGSILKNNKVECSSCHDPHFRNLSYDEVDSTYTYANHSDGSTSGGPHWCSGGEDCADGLFLRRVGGNTGSGVCRTCHNK